MRRNRDRCVGGVVSIKSCVNMGYSNTPDSDIKSEVTESLSWKTCKFTIRFITPLLVTLLLSKYKSEYPRLLTRNNGNGHVLSLCILPTTSFRARLCSGPADIHQCLQCLQVVHRALPVFFPKARGATLHSASSSPTTMCLLFLYVPHVLISVITLETSHKYSLLALGCGVSDSDF